ncbi:hypothetical protein J6590_005297 [Homalodisca vitripennis]|nr:hypothetical protein J6590_005297 [Homalodisca vitripennis]
MPLLVSVEAGPFSALVSPRKDIFRPRHFPPPVNTVPSNRLVARSGPGPGKIVWITPDQTLPDWSVPANIAASPPEHGERGALSHYAAERAYNIMTADWRVGKSQGANGTSRRLRTTRLRFQGFTAPGK